MKKLVSLFALIGTSLSLLAQDAAAVATPEATQNSGNYMMNIAIGVFITSIVVLLIVIFVLLKAVRVLSRELLNPAPAVSADGKRMEWEEWEAEENVKPSIWSKLLSLKPLSQEKDQMLDHDFDGITELDNPTPPWFMWLFYLTIFFGIGYMINYHILDGPMQEEEYATEMQQAELDKKALLATTANKIDENSVTIDESMIEAGKATFMVNCVACHGDKGQGGVGPNLTDEYWIHGGSINNIFKVIKYGVPEKGMVSWEKTMTPQKMAELSNYIHSLKGTNPPNAKEPQGNKEG
jgi:cytochrome c oxidase cbb3-type subunit 3